MRYEADVGCPDQPAFSAIVRGKLTAAGGTAANAPSPRIRVGLHATDSGFVGHLELQRADNSKYEREVTGASCAEVANALAFVLALALGVNDPPAASAIEPPASTPVVPFPQPPVPRLRAGTPTPVAPPRQPEPPVPRRHSLWTFGGGVQLGARSGLAPNWAVVESAFLEARRAQSSPFGFTLRMGFENVQTANLSSIRGTSDFAWWAGSVEACPVRLRLVESLELETCAGAHVGQLRGSGHPDPNSGGTSRTQSKIWLDGLTALRLEFALPHGLSLHVQGEMLLPITRYQYAFDGPSTTLYQVPDLASAGFLGLAGHFL
jgi:hypothetical protein